MGDSKNETREHLRSYRRLLEAEGNRLNMLVPLANSVHRHTILQHLKTIRVATQDLEALFKRTV